MLLPGQVFTYVDAQVLSMLSRTCPCSWYEVFFMRRLLVQTPITFFFFFFFFFFFYDGNALAIFFPSLQGQWGLYISPRNLHRVWCGGLEDNRPRRVWHQISSLLLGKSFINTKKGSGTGIVHRKVLFSRKMSDLLVWLAVICHSKLTFSMIRCLRGLHSNPVCTVNVDKVPYQTLLKTRGAWCPLLLSLADWLYPRLLQLAAFHKSAFV